MVILMIELIGPDSGIDSCIDGCIDFVVYVVFLKMLPF